MIPDTYVESPFAKAVARLPWCTPAELLKERGLVVVAPHPDDESLGCGGLLAWASRHKVPAHVVFLTDGEQSHPGTCFDVGNMRRTEAVGACAMLGITPLQMSFLGLPDTGLGTLAPRDRSRVIASLRHLFARCAPVLVTATTHSDAHSDHQSAFMLVNEAVMDIPDVELMTYPVWSWLNPVAPDSLQGVRIPIGDQRAAKRKAIAEYASQHGRGQLDVAGFTLPEELLRHVDTDFEVLLSVEV